MNIINKMLKNSQLAIGDRVYMKDEYDRYIDIAEYGVIEGIFEDGYDIIPDNYAESLYFHKHEVKPI